MSGIAIIPDITHDFEARCRELEAILEDCLVKWGCECPYCDRNFGEGFDGHADKCRIKQALKGAQMSKLGTTELPSASELGARTMDNWVDVMTSGEGEKYNRGYNQALMDAVEALKEPK